MNTGIRRFRRFNTVLAGTGDRPAGQEGVNEHWDLQGSVVLIQFRRVLAVDPQVNRAQMNAGICRVLLV